MGEYILWIIIGYLCGSIPFSYILPLFRGVDVRKLGSGNVGGTNVLRNMGPVMGALCMILDGAKAFVPVIVAINLYSADSWIVYLAGFFTVLGHNYPVWLRFKGGKGVACTVGSYFGISPLLGLFFFAVWIPTTLITQYVSIASLLALGVDVLIGFIYNYKLGLYGFLLLLLAVYRHRENIKRLLKGQENKTDLVKIFSGKLKK